MNLHKPTSRSLFLVSTCLALIFAGNHRSYAQQATPIGNYYLQGSNLGCWGTNSNGTINDPFFSSSGIRTKSTPVIGVMRFPCRSLFTMSQLQSIAMTITNLGLLPLAIVDELDGTNFAMQQVNALKGIVTYFEFGNEDNYFQGWSGTTYASNWAVYLPMLRAAAPNAQFGGPVCSYFQANGSQYLADFLNYIKGNAGLTPDFITMHYYSGHGEKPPWTGSQILSDVNTQMTPGLAALKSSIFSIMGTSIPLAITEWNYDGSPDANANLLCTNSVFMTNYANCVLNAFNTNAVWFACEYDFGCGAGDGYLDMVSTSDNLNPLYNAFLNWQSHHTNALPWVVTPPQNQTVTQGSNVTFSVAALGTMTLSYQWQLNGTNLSGAIADNYSITNVQPSAAGNYSVIISNVVGSVSNISASLTVTTTNVPPSITNQPQSQGAYEGASVTFSVTANGTTPLNYQWQFNSANIPGATGNSYTKNNVQYSDAGNYSVAITNVAGGAGSSNAALTVNVPVGGQILYLDFNASGQYTTNFNNPGNGGGSACTETNAGGVTNSGALLVTSGDRNATYTNAAWNFAISNASISVSMMFKLKQATSTGNKIQLGLVNSNNVGFAGASSGWVFGSFKLSPQSAAAPTYQLGMEKDAGSGPSIPNVGSAFTLIVGHWYQFNVYFTNTSPGASYNMACSLIDYGTDGATLGTNVLTFNTLQTVTGAYAALASDISVFPCFRVANDTGASCLDDFAVNSSGSPAQLNLVAMPTGQLTLSWGGTLPATLLSATNLAGPWILVTNTVSPYAVSVDPNSSQLFFKLEQ